MGGAGPRPATPIGPDCPAAFYGVLFDDHKEAAFANYRLWESLGFVIAFAYSNFLCVYVKLYVVLSILLIGIILYLVVEYLEYRKQKMCAKDTSSVIMTESTNDQNASQ
ncbi:unnamed protein product [Ranitomeya imitator]|uniref:Uncharacterized protein n=1 Tax=Ranitomeya imitator TaxID=111125 RepID=A0ABN9KTK6_9NEOB|nr:unnamed protein product [Ranitomeya imitator]